MVESMPLTIALLDLHVDGGGYASLLIEVRDVQGHGELLTVRQESCGVVLANRLLGNLLGRGVVEHGFSQRDLDYHVPVLRSRHEGTCNGDQIGVLVLIRTWVGELHDGLIVAEVLSYDYEVHPVLLALLARLVVDYQLDSNLVLEVAVRAGGQVPEDVGPFLPTGGCRNLEHVPLQGRIRTVPRVIEEDFPLVELYALLALGRIRVVALAGIERYAEVAGVGQPSAVDWPVHAGNRLRAV